LLWIISAWWFLFPPSPNAVERWFSRLWYRRLLDVATPLTQSVEFPVVMGLLAAGCILFLCSWARRWIRIRRGRQCSPWAGFRWGIGSLFLALPFVIAWFIIFWGAGYRRLPLEERLHLDTRPLSEREAEGLRDLLLGEIKRNLTPPAERETGRAVESIASAMAAKVGEWDGARIRLPCRVKRVPRGFLLASGTAGVCAPFTLEALVDSGLPDTAFVYASAHELGHIAGFCGEDEASFAGYLSGLEAGDRFARYACALNAYTDMINRLRGEEFRRAFGLLPGPAVQDLQRAEAAYRRYQIGWFRKLSWRVYNRYLQAQGVPEGVESYSRGIRLLGYAWRRGMVKGAF